MSKYVNEKEVTQCYHSCPFFKLEGNLMTCGHPKFEGGDPYDSLIISQDNSRDRVPDKCPLREETVDVILRVKLKVY
jgi:hypothetical protein